MKFVIGHKIFSGNEKKKGDLVFFFILRICLFFLGIGADKFGITLLQKWQEKGEKKKEGLIKASKVVLRTWSSGQSFQILS